MRKNKFYCPKCGKKQLIEDQEWTRGGYFRTWTCLYNQPTRSGRYYSKAPEKGPPCGLVIKAEGRHATIDDYGGVLSKLAKVNVPQIQQWLLENVQDVHKRGLVVLYQGPLVDVVRRRDRSGVGVGLYWRAQTWDDDVDLLNPFDTANSALRSQAASFVEHEGLPLKDLFHRNGLNVWAKDNPRRAFKDRPYGKKLKADIIKWAASLEAAMPDLIKECKREHGRWVRERSRLDTSVREIVDPTGMGAFRSTSYCGHTKTATMQFPYVSSQAALEIEGALEVSLRLPVLSVNPHHVSPTDALKIEAALGRKLAVNIANNLCRRRFTYDEAVEVAKILAANSE